MLGIGVNNHVGLLKMCVCLLPVVVLGSLGTWQVFRLREKLRMIESMNASPICIPGGGILQHNYRRVEADGVFDAPSHIRVFAGKDGYYFLQPLKLSNGKYILVNRGTFSGNAPSAQRTEMARSVSGVLYCKSHSKVKWVAKNNAEKNLWFWFDIDGMAGYMKLPLEPCIIWGDKSSVFPGLQPNLELKIRNDHLEYAITWYVLAALWIFVAYMRFLKNK